MDADKNQRLLKVRTTALLAALIWSLVVSFSLWTQRGQLDHTAEELARIDALANLKKDMAIRKWAASVGGIFINESRMPDLGTLQEQERLSGTRENGSPFKLIALTPIHILLAIQEIGNKEYGVKERLIDSVVAYITSVNFKDFPEVVAMVDDAFDQLGKTKELKTKHEGFAAKKDWEQANLWAEQVFRYQVKTADLGLRAKTFLEQNGAKKVAK